MRGPRRVNIDVSYGGQAVIEGVMMRGPRKVAIAVRGADHEVVIHQEQYLSWGDRFPMLRLPFLRGVVALFESLKLGINALVFSANAAATEEEKLSEREMATTMVVSFLLAIGLFVILPTLAIGWLENRLPNSITLNLLEGGLRVAILLGYIWFISMMPDIRRVLQYHGAEHKAINTYEAGDPLTVENVRRHSRFHPRCGTSFLLFVALVAILLFTFFGWPDLWARIGIRLLLLPVVAGLAYEFIRLSGRSNSAWLEPIILPGLWLQRLTTLEPDDDQIEVSIAALRNTMG